MDNQINKEKLKNYVSKTMFNFRKLNIETIPNDTEPLAIDIGYGGVKIFSLNGIHSFPALLFKSKKNSTILNNDTDIKYIDENNNLWYIGDRARDSLETGSRQIDSNEYYSEKRLFTDEFLILVRVSIFLGVCKELNNFSLEQKKLKYVQVCPKKM